MRRSVGLERYLFTENGKIQSIYLRLLHLLRRTIWNKNVRYIPMIALTSRLSLLCQIKIEGSRYKSIQKQNRKI